MDLLLLRGPALTKRSDDAKDRLRPHGMTVSERVGYLRRPLSDHAMEHLLKTLRLYLKLEDGEDLRSRLGGGEEDYGIDLEEAVLAMKTAFGRRCS